MKQQLTLLVKHVDDKINEDNAEDVISDLLRATGLDKTSPPTKLPNSKTNDYLYDVHANDHDYVPYYTLVTKWCSDRDWLGWLTVQNSTDNFDELQYQPRVYVRVLEMSVGNLLDRRTYIKHLNLKPENTKKILIDFEHDMQRISCFIITEDDWYKLSFDYRSVEGFVIGDLFMQNLSMYLPIRNPPKIWVTTKDDVEKQKKEFLKRHGMTELDAVPEKDIEENVLKYVRWLRQNYIGDCKPEVFGGCSVFQFCIDDSDGDDNAAAHFSHIQVIAGFIKHGYTMYFSSTIEADEHPKFRSNIIERLLKDNPFKNPQSNFSILYGLLMLVSKGSRCTDFFTISHPLYTVIKDLLKSLKNENHILPLLKSFALLCNRIEQRRFLDLDTELSALFEKELATHAVKDVLTENNKNLSDHGKFMHNNKNLLMVRRITVTPTRILFQPPELNTSNRVLRQFDPDNFVRVSFRDEDFSNLNLNFEYETKHNSVIERISDIFHKGIQIGEKGRRYHFLGCSNSQLRSSGAWFVVEANEVTVDYIRKWVGDFSKERSLSKYVSRLGLAFTTTETLHIEAKEEHIPDIKTAKGDYTFSDGIGKISEPIAKMIQERRDLDYLPSAFQIRYGGCKGMVALDPTIGSEGIIQIRPSMRKFESNHKEIEFCQASKPSLLYMNRQVIWLLRGYRIPKEEFINLQNDTLVNLADSLRYAHVASKNLSNYQGDGIFKQVEDSGIDLTKEPHHRRQLLSLYTFHVKEVLNRTRIVMKENVGRGMLGVMDETGTLEYGQVFVQYSVEVAFPRKDTLVKIGPMFITKNPCVHPGDLRRFTGVDVPALHHMCDVVVFPAKGKRPHPNELSGSDLDGDEYFVCWLSSLIPRGLNHDPGDYLGGETKLENEPIISEQLTNHVIRHITKPNNLGMISNAHSVHCDKDKDGVLCDEARELAKQHSIAVDYPKTGIAEDFSRELRVYEFPDWMEKPDKPCYRSTSVVGDCYRICRSLFQVLGEQDGVFDSNNIELDKRLIIEGFGQYQDSAIELCKEYNHDLSRLMSQYGLEDEGDIACGCLNKVKMLLDRDRKKNYDITEECVRFYRTLQAKYQKIFFDEFGTKKGEWMEYKEECYKKATAWYLAAYKYVKPEHDQVTLLSFPWCVSEVLCKLAKISADIPALKQKTCTENMAEKMIKWFQQCQTQEPNKLYKETMEELEPFIAKFDLVIINNQCLGLPFSSSSITLATRTNTGVSSLVSADSVAVSPTNSSVLELLRQEMFEEYPGWDKSFLELSGNKEIYLTVRYTPNICVLAELPCFEKIYTIRQYLTTYPILQVPAATVVKWCDANSLDTDLHVLLVDFVLLFLYVMIMENHVEPLKIAYSNDKGYYFEELKKDVKLQIPALTTGTIVADLYLTFLKSLIYGKCSKDHDNTTIPDYMKKQTMDLRDKLNSNSTKYVSYAMREYHETCYFLFNNDQDLSDISARRGKKNKIAKYKRSFCYPVCYNPELCSQHLKKHSNLEVNMRQITLQRHEVLVIEVWGNTPEVLQDITESMQVVLPFRAPHYSRNMIEVDGAYRIYLGQIVPKLDKFVTYTFIGPEGYKRLVPIKSILEFNNWDNLLNSCVMFLMERTKFMRKNHNVYSHGTLSATCEFGRFQPFLNCCQKDGGGKRIKYENTMRPEINDRLIAALGELGFVEQAKFDRVRWTLLYDGIPLTVHCTTRGSDNTLHVENLTWADMLWCEMHMFTERHRKDDRHAHRDLLFNISSCANLTDKELLQTKSWKDLDNTLSENIKYGPNQSYVSGVGTLGDATLTNHALNNVVNDYTELVIEDVTSYVLSASQFSRLSKVTFDLIKRRRKPYNQKFSSDTEISYHLVATLPYFDVQSTGLLNDFFQKICLKLH